MNSIVQLFKYFGAFAAIVACVGFLSNSDYALLESRDVDSFKEMSLASDNDHVATNNDRVPAYQRPGNVSRNRPSTASYSRTIARIGEESKSTNYGSGHSDKPRKPEYSISAREIENWIQMNVAQTYLESEKETMSPGVILATGVYFLQEGKGDAAMNAADVAAYLAEVRHSASAKAKAKMKYIANSDAWFEGLKIAGFDGDKIATIFNEHELKAYDKQMYSRHVERKIEETSYEVEDAVMAEDKVKRNRNLADAYNEYADRPEVRKKHGLPTYVATKASSAKEVSEARLQAEAFHAGETKKFNDPKVFWSVLKEMIALENQYDSWDEYVADQPQAANKAFQSRSNVMSMGGVMKVTREEGA